MEVSGGRSLNAAGRLRLKDASGKACRFAMTVYTKFGK